MFLFVFAEAKRRSGEIAKFQFLIPANLGVASFSQKVLVTVVFLFIYFAVPNPGF